MSRVTCPFFFSSLFFGQSGEAYRWRVCYQRGLPRLVLLYLENVQCVNYDFSFFVEAVSLKQKYTQTKPNQPEADIAIK